MVEKYLVVNAGSSSLKFSLYEMPEKREIVNGYIEKIGREDSFYTLKFDEKKIEEKKSILTSIDAVEIMLSELLHYNFIQNVSEIKGVGHRIVHGGEFYSSSVLLDEKSLNNIRTLEKLAKKHMPSQIKVVEYLTLILGAEVPQVAVFDTAYHQSMPSENYRYAVPKEWYTENAVRKYGFHGTSYDFVVKDMQKEFKKENVNLIVCHVGSGVSICAIKDGKSYDTTMGLTPLDGVIMGTRSGSIDPAVVEYIMQERNLSAKEVLDILNNESGLLGLCGENDCRDVEKLVESNNEDAILAMDKFEVSVVDVISKYYVRLMYEINKNNKENEPKKELDGIVFTAGVGENNCRFRKAVIDRLSYGLDVEIDTELNNKIAKFKGVPKGKITTDNSSIKVFVVSTNEELMILQDTERIIKEKERDNNMGSNGNTQKKVLQNS